MYLPIGRPGVPNIKCLFSIKVLKIIILGSVKTENITSNMAANIILYNFISSVLNMNILD